MSEEDSDKVAKRVCVCGQACVGVCGSASTKEREWERKRKRKRMGEGEESAREMAPKVKFKITFNIDICLHYCIAEESYGRKFKPNLSTYEEHIREKVYLR